jgi:hypothetical protein
MGRGVGGGLAGRRGTSRREGSPQPSGVMLSREEKLKKMQDQARDLRKQIEAIETSITAFEE